MKYFISYLDSDGWEVTEVFEDEFKAQDFVNIHFPDIVRIIIGTDIEFDVDKGPPAL